MTSPDGITWTIGTSAANSAWYAVTYGNQMFVAVAVSGTGRVMTSQDGTTWTIRATPGDADWNSITFGNGRFVALAKASNKAMNSSDGVTWSQAATPGGTSWWSVTSGNGMFVAVGASGTGTRVMTSNGLMLTQAGDVIKVVPPSGTAPEQIQVLYNTADRVAAGKRWGIWGNNWPVAMTSTNTVDIDLATYQDAGSCVALGMSETDCPRALGVLAPGGSMLFKARVKVSGTWSETPSTLITRP
jgi:hypothetical protein